MKIRCCLGIVKIFSIPEINIEETHSQLEPRNHKITKLTHTISPTLTARQVRQVHKWLSITKI